MKTTQKTCIYTRKIPGKGTIKLFNRNESLYMEVYSKATQQRNLTSLHLYLTGNLKANKTIIRGAEDRIDNYDFAETAEASKETKIKNFTTFCLDRIKRVEKEKSRHIYELALTKLQEWAGEHISFRKVNEAFLQAYKGWLVTEAINRKTKKPLSQNAADTYMNIIKTWANIAQAKGYLSGLYIRDIKRIGYDRKEVVYFNKEELKKLKNTPYPNCPWLPKFYFLQFATLQRFSDVHTITFESLLNMLHQQKTNKKIYLFVNENLVKWVAGKRLRAGKVFEKTLSYDRMLKHLQAWVKLAGIDKRAGTHTFRRSGASLLYEACKDLELVATLLGHGNTETTRIYIGLSKEQYKAAFNAFDSVIDDLFSEAV